MSGVDLFSWNPSRPWPSPRWGPVPRIMRPVNNFGDLLGPVVVRRVLEQRGLPDAAASTPAKLFSIGSVLHFARDGDVVWGSGVNGKVAAEEHQFSRLDVRAVRGPLTRAFLTDRGIHVPEVYGDPALLLGHLWPRLRAEPKRHRLTVVPNLHDHASTRHPQAINPRGNLWRIITRIARSELVVGSSLHGIIVADALGIPARLVVPGAEPAFKYEDYYRGSGRDDYTPAATVEEAVAMGGEPLCSWDAGPLLASFPDDLWR